MARREINRPEVVCNGGDLEEAVCDSGDMEEAVCDGGDLEVAAPLVPRQRRRLLSGLGRFLSAAAAAPLGDEMKGRV